MNSFLQSKSCSFTTSFFSNYDKIIKSHISGVECNSNENANFLLDWNLPPRYLVEVDLSFLELFRKQAVSTKRLFRINQSTISPDCRAIVHQGNNETRMFESLLSIIIAIIHWIHLILIGARKFQTGLSIINSKQYAWITAISNVMIRPMRLAAGLIIIFRVECTH